MSHRRFIAAVGLLSSLSACTPLYPARSAEGPAPERLDPASCRRLSDKFATSGGVTKVTGPLAAAGGVTAAIFGARDKQGASAAAGVFAMTMAVGAAVSGILHESYTIEYVDRCTVNAGGAFDVKPTR